MEVNATNIAAMTGLAIVTIIGLYYSAKFHTAVYLWERERKLKDTLIARQKEYIKYLEDRNVGLK